MHAVCLQACGTKRAVGVLCLLPCMLQVYVTGLLRTALLL